MENIIEVLKNAIGEENVIENEPMSKHTTFRIGGNADIFVTPQSTEDIENVIRIAEKTNTPYYIIGNGSNLLVKDNGIRGIVIQIYKKYSDITIEGNEITVQSGALLSTVAKKAMENSLTGFEFASGIPGTIGGAVCMNAGAYGGEIKDVLISCKVLKNGKIVELNNEQAGFEYRNSRIMAEKMIVLEAVLKLEKGDKEEISSKMKELNSQRNTKQPVEFPSAGSTFKRPDGYFAAKLIDDSGLRGFSVGKAQVSPKHCGFVVNNGGATAQEVLELIDKVTEIVYDKFKYGTFSCTGHTCYYYKTHRLFPLLLTYNSNFRL